MHHYPQYTQVGEICKCGKVCLDKKSAQTRRNFHEERGGRRALRIYHCPESNLWHLTRAVGDDYKK